LFQANDNPNVDLDRSEDSDDAEVPVCFLLYVNGSLFSSSLILVSGSRRCTRRGRFEIVLGSVSILRARALCRWWSRDMVNILRQ
jgi:hypothetical protein